MSFARTTMRGRFLKERFAVNGIQKASRSLGFGADFSAGRDMRKLLLTRSYTSLGLAQEPKPRKFPGLSLKPLPDKRLFTIFRHTSPRFGQGKSHPFFQAASRGRP